MKKYGMTYAEGWKSFISVLVTLFLALFFLSFSSHFIGTASASDESGRTPLISFNALLVGDDARARLVVDFDRKPDFSYHYLANPARLVITLPATVFGFPDVLLKPRGLISDIQYGATGPDQSRIVITGSEPVQVTLAEVRDNVSSGSRLVIDLSLTNAERFSMLVSEQKTRLRSDTSDVLSDMNAKKSKIAGVAGQSFVVAIDAGHGGVDTGAVGEDTKTYEKDITLDFARAFSKRLQQEPGFESYLTRDSDVFLSLSKRVELARQHGADLFISLHADSLSQSNISGSTVYTLSDRASDRLAANLARRENLSNEIAGINSDVEPEAVTDILLDLTRKETQNFSISLADHVVASFAGQIGLINNPHRFAGFMVLRAPDIPSILLEIGFLSNPEDEKRMLDSIWRDQLVERLIEAVKQYHSPLVARSQ